MEYAIKNLLEVIIGIQAILVIAFITQFISNLTIITQLPKIKRLCETMCYDEDEKEEIKQNQSKENILSLILFTVVGIAVGIFIMCMFL